MRIDFDRQKIKKGGIFFISFLLLALFGWYVASQVTAQVPPPATTICAIMPSLCPPGGGGGGGEEPPPSPVTTYSITKEVTAINGEPYTGGSTIKSGDEIKYKIKVTKTVTN